MSVFIKTILTIIIGGLATIFIVSQEIVNNTPTDYSENIVITPEKSASTTASQNTPDENELKNIEDVPKLTSIDPETEEVNQPKVMDESKPEVVDITSELVEFITIPPVQEIILSSNELNTKAREALVNIICTTKSGGLINPITGSGIIIDDRGVILTNAHIAQYYLLEDYSTEDFINCTIRAGSPAVNKYKAELLFVSSAWVNDNHEKIKQQNPKGTGENDFALLLITESTNQNVPLPKKFPFVSPDTREQIPKTTDSVIIASYPAGFLGGTAIQKELYAVSTITQVGEIFTFDKETLDLFSIGGNIVAQKGSSGGGVLNTAGNLIGIVVTASEGDKTSERDLRAITLSHVNRSLIKETGVSLNNYLFGGLLGKSIQFRTLIAPILTNSLENALNN